MMKNYFLLAAATMSLFSASAAWDGTAQEWTKGNGTQSSPYLIENEQHLAYFQQQVTAGNSYKGEYIRLENDLDMSADAGMKILPIGFFDEYVNPDDPQTGGLIDESKYFLGTFDGNFKTIDNIHIEYVATDFEAVGGTGLFACLDDGALVKNVILGANSIVTGGELTAGIVGQMNGGMLQCSASLATINSASTFGTGGVVAVASNGAKVDRCYFAGTLAGNSDVGGIVGTAQYGAEITNCYNAGVVSAPNGMFVGGIVGSAYDNGTRIVNCYNVGEVISAETFMSKPEPIVGDPEYKVLIQNCYFLDNGTFTEASGVVKKTDEEMKSEAMVMLLNAGDATMPWEVDTHSYNNGYPVFAWQNNPYASVSSLPQSALKVGVMNGAIYLHGVDNNESVRVYNILGRLVYQGTASVVTNMQPGVYIVEVAGRTAKVRL
ncbi:MAG: T9SS type A sorting domain-containing protein [Paludibacteraceae bacterium]|nr:T9SS type A sorting domain-containing protein [Paludibacteraceae bacterium]